MVWNRNGTFWYEEEFIKKIYQIAWESCLICCECTEDEQVKQCGYRDILHLIRQEVER